MKTYKLYIKTSPLGLKYLGYTEQEDVEKYPGSGLYWKKHLKAHKIKAKQVTTEIIYESDDKKKIEERGAYYSNLYEVVKSEEWANLTEEKGPGNDGKVKKKIFQVDVNTGELVNTFFGNREACKATGINFTKICEVCNGNRLTAGGFKWFYEGEVKPYVVAKRIISQIEANTGEVVATFFSSTQASKATKVDNGDISRVLNGKARIAGGYKWEMKSEELTITPEII